MNSGEIKAHLLESNQSVRIVWRDGVISQLEPASDAPRDVWIAPPLMDLQANGYAGVDFQADDVDLKELLHAVRELGAAACGSFLLTLITDDWSQLLRRLQRLRQIRADSSELQTAIAGWHVEGPFLSAEPGFRGAHYPAVMRDPTPADMDRLREVAATDRLLVTLAPEREGSIETIERAKSLGIRISLGHTNASASRIDEAVRAGAIAFTHLGNGCPVELNRHDNILWRLFERDDLFVGLIPDAIHVSAPLFRLIHRVIPRERIYYVSDAMAAAGSAPGRYRIGRLELEVAADGIVCLPGSSNFAGSALRPIEGVRLASEMLHCSWRDVWPSFSRVPCRIMDMTNELKVGNPATFCAIDAAEGADKFNGVKLFVNGELAQAGS